MVLVLSKIEKLTYDYGLPIAQAEGYEIYDVEYVKEGPHWFLRIFIDREDGVNVDDCETISRNLGTVLDENDFIQTNYFLEVSSPGIERNLRQEEHFQKAIGQKIKIKLYRATDGVKEIDGELLKADKNGLILKTDKKEIEIENKNIAKANILFEF